ncbi:MAG TPA: DNA-3-methyladenine glycosylase I [Acidisoma sp.]|jgi:DNA-3-methyladenine glycosylase I|nr:DNA-3-methyladenine glycosylase I [Acidisoma sp.]
MTGTIPCPDGRLRCRWCAAAPGFLAYHDQEWGFPVDNDQQLFEKFCLEGFQSGLSWRTILAKRENFRAAFHNFDIERVAAMTEDEVEALMVNDGIVRNRRKILAAINNARRAQQLTSREGSLAAYVWRFEPAVLPGTLPQTRVTAPESVAMSDDLKRRGWAFVGPTTVFALMQAMGLVNDHAEDCVIRGEVARARAAFRKPG